VLDPFFHFMAVVLSWFYELIPSYGVAIVLLTVAILLLVTPLTLKGTRSMLELQIHQPELRRIQQQYRDDRQRMNEELMKFYQEHKINPVGGCLPLLIQAPVFIILYNVIRGLTQRTSALTSFVTFGDSSHTGFFDPKYIDHSSQLYRALNSTSEMNSWGIDLSRTAFQALGDSFTAGLPYLLLIAIATAASYYQQKQIQGRSTQQMNPQMQTLTRIMPLFITVISLTLPAALTVYFVASGLYRIGQQAIITRHIYGPHSERLAEAQAKSATIDTKAREGGKGAKADASAPAPGGFLGKLLGGAEPPQIGKAAREARGGGSNGSTTNGSKKQAGAAKKPAGPPAKPMPARPSGRVTPPGSGGNRPATSKKKKRK
jgi:YidC/Oxa1 family membrane protein insertase